MRTSIRRVLSLALCLVLLCSGFTFGTSALTADESWQHYYADYMQTGSGMYMAPGADESTRNFSWYAPENAGTGRVIVSENKDLSDACTFTGGSVRTPEGDVRTKVTVTQLQPGKTYYYRCENDVWQSGTASFHTLSGTDFSAMYTTDIHITTKEENDENSLVNQSYTFSRVLDAAADKAQLDLLISAGDQATTGSRREYTSLVSAPALSSIPFALCPGNHDRKGIAYKYFTNNPGEYKKAIVHSLISYDYAYTKGDVLFFVFDSNVASMTDHRNFVKDAIRKYPDAKWRVATFHHDLYGGRIPHRENENALLRTIWAPIIDEFRFDLVLLGHSHYYTMSNAIFRNKTAQDLTGQTSVTNPKGAIVMVSGSINHPRIREEGSEIPPLGENIAFSYLTNEPIYNILDFSEDSITIRSYALSEEDPFHTFTITKTDPQGGHPENGRTFYDFFVRFIADIFGVINEVWTTARFRLHWNDFVGK